MRSVIDPVLPPGFEFAIVDQDGEVQFHSDTQRNVHENLLLETDRNARLQSLILAHGEGSLNTSYWGRPYRAHVRPTVIPGWSIVALHDKQQTRPLVLEWTAAALSMQALYTLGLDRGDAHGHVARPSWLWPDPLRRPWYGSIAMVCVTALLFWAVVAARYDVTTSALVGVTVPVVVWVVTYLLLATRPPGHARQGLVGAVSRLSRGRRAAADCELDAAGGGVLRAVVRRARGGAHQAAADCARAGGRPQGTVFGRPTHKSGLPAARPLRHRVLRQLARLCHVAAGRGGGRQPQ